MEKYITIKRFKGKAICGNVNIPYGTELYRYADAIWLDDKHPLFFDHSQNAYDYTARNDDGNGKKRGKLIKDIMSTLGKREGRDDQKYQARWDIIWNDPSLLRFKRKEHGDYWLWNHEFYNAEIADLEYIWNKVRDKHTTDRL